MENQDYLKPPASNEKEIKDANAKSYQETIEILSKRLESLRQLMVEFPDLLSSALKNKDNRKAKILVDEHVALLKEVKVCEEKIREYIEKYEKVTGEKYQLLSNELETEGFFSSLKNDVNTINVIEENTKIVKNQDVEEIVIPFEDDKSL